MYHLTYEPETVSFLETSDKSQSGGGMSVGMFEARADLQGPIISYLRYKFPSRDVSFGGDDAPSWRDDPQSVLFRIVAQSHEIATKSLRGKGNTLYVGTDFYKFLHSPVPGGIKLYETILLENGIVSHLNPEFPDDMGFLFFAGRMNKSEGGKVYLDTGFAYRTITDGKLTLVYENAKCEDYGRVLTLAP